MRWFRESFDYRRGSKIEQPNAKDAEVRRRREKSKRGNWNSFASFASFALSAFGCWVFGAAEVLSYTPP